MMCHASICRCVVLLTRVGAVLALLASPAFAQSQGRVLQDGATIWRSDVSIVAATASAGTIVDVTAQSDLWYEIVIPANLGGRGERGLIARRQVQLLPGTPQPPVRALRGSPAPAAEEEVRRPAVTGLQPRTSRPAASPEPVFAIRGFGQAAFVMLSAQQSFEALLGTRYGPSFGGGVQVRFRPGLFAQVSWERFQQVGQRVFIFQGTVFPLATDNTITMMPIRATAGYRFVNASRVTPFVGGGLAKYRLSESSPVSDEAEEFRDWFTGYHGIGGVEFQLSRWMAVAVEGQYTRVPNALGVGGVSEIYEERDLGGRQVQMKFLLGR